MLLCVDTICLNASLLRPAETASLLDATPALQRVPSIPYLIFFPFFFANINGKVFLCVCVACWLIQLGVHKWAVM